MGIEVVVCVGRVRLLYQLKQWDLTRCELWYRPYEAEVPQELKQWKFSKTASCSGYININTIIRLRALSLHADDENSLSSWKYRRLPVPHDSGSNIRRQIV